MVSGLSSHLRPRRPTRYVRVRYLDRAGHLCTLVTFPSVSLALVWAQRARRSAGWWLPTRMFLEGRHGSATRPA